MNGHPRTCKAGWVNSPRGFESPILRHCTCGSVETALAAIDLLRHKKAERCGPAKHELCRQRELPRLLSGREKTLPGRSRESPLRSASVPRNASAGWLAQASAKKLLAGRSWFGRRYCSSVMGRCAVILALGVALAVASCSSPAPPLEGDATRPAATSPVERSPTSTSAETPAPANRSVHAYIRVDQSGYLPRQSKYAYVMAPHRLAGEVVDVVSGNGQPMMTAKVGKRKAWTSRFPYVYSVDFSPLTRTGRYSLVLRGTTVHSPPFMVLTPKELWSRY